LAGDFASNKKKKQAEKQRHDRRKPLQRAHTTSARTPGANSPRFVFDPPSSAASSITNSDGK